MAALLKLWWSRTGAWFHSATRAIETEGKYAAVVVNLAEKAVVAASASRALDLRGDLRLSVTNDGQIRLAREKVEAGLVSIENPKLGGLMRMSSSPGLDWLAVSNSRRAVIWNVGAGNGQLSLPFEHAQFQSGNLWQMATAPLLDQKQTMIEYDLAKRSWTKSGQSDEDPAKSPIRFWNGPVRFLLKQTDRDATIEASDGLGKTLWSETFANPPFPTLSLSPELLAVTWSASSPQGGKLIKADPELKKEKAQSGLGGSVVQVRNTRTGTLIKERLISAPPANSLAVNSHLLQPSGVTIAGKWIVLQEPGNRILIEKWEDGAVVTRSFGQPLAFDPAGAKLIVQNRERELKIINLNTGAASEPFQFPERVAAATFSSDGLKLGALTVNQKALYPSDAICIPPQHAHHTL